VKAEKMHMMHTHKKDVLQCVAECCGVLQCVAAWCSVLLCVKVRMMRMHTPEQPHLDTTYYIPEEPHHFKNDYTFRLLTTPVDKMHLFTTSTSDPLPLSFHTLPPTGIPPPTPNLLRAQHSPARIPKWAATAAEVGNKRVTTSLSPIRTRAADHAKLHAKEGSFAALHAELSNQFGQYMPAHQALNEIDDDQDDESIEHALIAPPVVAINLVSATTSLPPSPLTPSFVLCVCA